MKISLLNMKPVVNVFIFRRDLRIEDNLALNALVAASPNVPVVPIFIFNPIQISPLKNSYYCRNAVQFMIESIKDLKVRTHDALVCFHGYDTTILEQLIKIYTINAIGFNVDYTPFAKRRDEQIRIWCQNKDIDLFQAEDYTLFQMGQVMTDSGKPYEVYTPFYKKAISKINTIENKKTVPAKFLKIKHSLAVKDLDAYIHGGVNLNIAVKGGRANALLILDRINKKEFARYDGLRDYPSREATTKLSAYLKFGCVSVREVFSDVKKTYGVSHGLARELLWREFFAHITHHFPKILDGQAGGINKIIREKHVEIKWNENEEHYKKWCAGKTGYPMVDAGMRQMNATGWMHNRCRMITSNFLTKDLFIDWRKGEMYFAQNLVDYDPASNSGGWQGTETQPPFRVFSPTLQAQRFDNSAEFIKKWIPELKNVPANDIVTWDTAYVKYPNIKYPSPIVFHKEQLAKLASM